jgi:hypothetical protein
MAKYIIKNISGKILEVIVPAPEESGRSSAMFSLMPNQTLNIVPWAGSIAACKKIAQLTRYTALNYIQIIEE